MKFKLILSLILLPLVSFAAEKDDICFDGLVTDSVAKIIKENKKDSISDDMYKNMEVTISPLWHDEPDSNNVVECPALSEILYKNTNTIEQRNIKYIVTPLNSEDGREYKVSVKFPESK